MKEIPIKEFRKLFEQGLRTFENYTVNPEFTLAHGYYDKDDTIEYHEAFNDKEIKNLSIVNCVFNVNLSFLDVQLEELSEPHFLKNVVFNGNVSFIKTLFKIECLIEDCVFNKKVKFVSCEFFGKTDFVSVTFNDDLVFEKEFISNEDYTNYDFETKYLSPNLKSKADKEAEYLQKGYNIFHECTKFLCNFNGRSIFNYITFLTVDFSKSFFSNNFTEFKFVEFKNLGLFRYLILDKNLTFISCDLTNCSFLFSKFDEANFISCYFDLKFLVDERMPNAFEFPREEIYGFGLDAGHSILSYSKSDIINTYTIFEINFDKHKDFETAGNFHIKRFESLRSYYLNNIFKNFSKYKIITHLKLLLPQKNNPDEINHSSIWYKIKYRLGLSDIFKKESYYDKVLYGKTKYRALRLTNYTLTIICKLLFINLYKISSNYGESYLRCLFWILVSTFLLFPCIYIHTGISFTPLENTNKIENLKKQNQIIIQYYPYNENTTFNLINDYGVGLIHSLNSTFPFKRGFENVNSANFLTTSIAFFQTITVTTLLTLFIVGIRRKFKR